MAERRIKPRELDIGMKFRLTGEAENPDERDMENHVYEVTNLDMASKFAAHLIIKDVETGVETDTLLMPWVPVILIEP
jgi:hypothetical protein